MRIKCSLSLVVSIYYSPISLFVRLEVALSLETIIFKNRYELFGRILFSFLYITLPYLFRAVYVRIYYVAISSLN